MKRFHVHVGVTDIDRSVAFYSSLFGARPSVVKGDYAKWMLEDPRINFAISMREDATKGVEHVGSLAYGGFLMGHFGIAAGVICNWSISINCHCYSDSSKHTYCSNSNSI